MHLREYEFVKIRAARFVSRLRLGVADGLQSSVEQDSVCFWFVRLDGHAPQSILSFHSVQKSSATSVEFRLTDREG